MLKLDSKILVVDDLESARQLIIRAFTALGYTCIHEAFDGADGFKKIDESVKAGQPFSLVFSDVNMPNMSGIELLTKCKETEALKNIPIVMVTAEAEIQVVTQALKIGAYDYLKKPISIAGLKAKIEIISGRMNKPAA